MLALGVGYGFALVAALVRTFPRRIGTTGGALAAAYGLAAVVEVPVMSALTRASDWITALRLVGTSVTLLAVGTLLLLPALPPSQERAVRGVLPWRLLRRLPVTTAVPLGSYALSQVGIVAQDLRLVAAFGTGAVMLAALTNLLGRFLGGLLSDHVPVEGVMLVIILLDAGGGVLLWRSSWHRG